MAEPAIVFNYTKLKRNYSTRFGEFNLYPALHCKTRHCGPTRNTIIDIPKIQDKVGIELCRRMPNLRVVQPNDGPSHSGFVDEKVRDHEPVALRFGERLPL